MKSIRVAGACLNQTPLDWRNNLNNILNSLEAARKADVSVLCLPELCISGYGCEDAFFSDYVTDRSLSSLEAIIPETRGLVVTVGLPMVFENCVYNVVALLVNGQVAGFVPKQELAGEGIHYEPRWFKPWPEHRRATFRWNDRQYPIGDLIFEVDGLRIGFEICEDAWNGIRPAQRHYLNNVDIILNTSASHFAFGKTRIREMLVREASRAYSCTYVYSNLLGNEAGRVVYDGEILIAQSGTLLARNRQFQYAEYQLLSAVIDTSIPRRARKKTFAFEPMPPEHLIRTEIELPDLHQGFRRDGGIIDPFACKEEEFHRAVTLAMFDYMRKSRSCGFVLSLSGGADSSATAVLAAEAIKNAERFLPREQLERRLSYLDIDWERPLTEQLITCVYQATEHSSSETEESARELAQEIGARYFRWDVEPNVVAYEQQIEKSLGRELSWETDDLALQNIQARVRAPGIWMIANIQNGLLLTTSNRSEAAVGYATMDGDTAGGLAPLGGIDKATLLKWLTWAENALNYQALRYVNSLQPTAELRPTDLDQTDENDLMPYPVLDAIERAAIHDYQSPVQVFKTLRGMLPDKELKRYVVRFFKLWARNQWKRERYAPSFHLDDANLDPRTWCRYPILNGGYKEELEELEAYFEHLLQTGEQPPIPHQVSYDN